MKNILANSTISTKIITMLLLLGAVTMFVAWRGSTSLGSADRAYSGLTDVKDPDAVRIALIQQDMTGMLYSGYMTLAYDGASQTARGAERKFNFDYKAAQQLLSEFRTAEPDAPELAGIAATLDRLHTVIAAAVASGLGNDNDNARQFLVRADQIQSEFSPKLEAMIAARRNSAQTRSDELTGASGATMRTLYLLAISSIVACIGVVLVVSRLGITGPLGRLKGQMGDIARGDYSAQVEGLERGDEIGAMAKAVQVFRENGIAKQASDAARLLAEAEQKMVVDTLSAHLSDLSGGDLTAAIKVDFPGEYAILKTNFNEALHKLGGLISAVGESAATIRAGSGEVAQASEDLARRTEGNAASLEETSAALAQIDTRLRATALSSGQTVARADQAIVTVGGGRSTAEEAVAAMGRVSESAKGIDSVIEGLDKIAFQTRVLAMNAAVEAGRAGDAGRGFAVVADPVNAIAMRAEEEAKRARDQLTLTQTDIVTAVQAVEKVDGALANISGDVDEVHKLLGTMADDAAAQSTAISQITAAISTMDQSTQQNAAMVEETSAAARSLTSEVTSLADQAAMFKTEDAGGAGRAWQQSASTAPAPAITKQRKVVAPARSRAKPGLAMAAAGGGSTDDWDAF
ncbi:methyl-accepting chemotaxis protein [soil metagenome]